jgi:hypothetical protein
MRAPQRRATFLAGRIAAKRLLMESMPDTGTHFASLRPADMHIETRAGDAARGQRPAVLLMGRPSPLAMSIAHTARGVLVAMANEPDVTPGVDLVDDQRRLHHLEWCFAASERRWVAATAGRGAGQLWAMKEALYKASHDGEGFAPGQIDVAHAGGPLYPGLSSRRVVRSLQIWRVDGHFAALAVVGPRDRDDREVWERIFVLSCEQIDD